MSPTNSAFSTSCTVDSPRPFREWFPLNSKDHPPNGWEKIVEVDVMLSPVCVRVSRSAREPFLFLWTGSCPMSLAVPRLVRFRISRSAVFPCEDVIPNYRSDYDELTISTSRSARGWPSFLVRTCAKTTVRCVLDCPPSWGRFCLYQLNEQTRARAKSSLVKTWRFFPFLGTV